VLADPRVTGDAGQSPLTGQCLLIARPDSWVLALDEALASLSKFDARKGRLVELRYFGGLSVEEAAQVLGVSPVTA